MRETHDVCFLFQAEDGIRDLVRSRGLGDVYKRQLLDGQPGCAAAHSLQRRALALQPALRLFEVIGEVLSLIHI